MPVEKGEIFAQRDVFVDYPFESVMFRWDHKQQKIFRKFYGEKEDANPIDHANRLFNEALLGGEEISQTTYAQECKATRGGMGLK